MHETGSAALPSPKFQTAQCHKDHRANRRGTPVWSTHRVVCCRKAKRRGVFGGECMSCRRRVRVWLSCVRWWVGRRFADFPPQLQQSIEQDEHTLTYTSSTHETAAVNFFRRAPAFPPRLFAAEASADTSDETPRVAFLSMLQWIPCGQKYHGGKNPDKHGLTNVHPRLHYCNFLTMGETVTLTSGSWLLSSYCGVPWQSPLSSK